MIRNARELAAVAYALIAKGTELTAAERELVPQAKPFTALLRSVRAEIHAGKDPLGMAFCAIRTPKERRDRGATYTPDKIVTAMIAWAKGEHAKPARVVDAGAGSGRFTVAAAKAFPAAQLVAVEIDPLATLMLRANASVLGFAERLTVEPTDYRRLALPDLAGKTLFIGNPPYVRHHDIARDWKLWLADTAAGFGLTASGLAGLHIHFFVKTRAIARPGDYGAFITAAEWLDVNYGSILRKMLGDGLGGMAIDLIDPKAQPFADALSTGAITCFRVGRRPDQLLMRSVESLDELTPLGTGRGVSWDELTPAHKWSLFIRQSHKPAADHIELGELFRVHRGQVSGKNVVWIESPFTPLLPAQFLFPSVTKARDILDAGHALNDPGRLKRVVDLPPDLSGLTRSDRKAVDAFIGWAKEQGAAEGWIATHRRAWWSVGLRAPAPILCTYMARRAPAFVRNHVGARHLNIAHGLYPVEPLADKTLDAVIRYLRATVQVASGRTYAGGLVKFEPGEVERLHIPTPEMLAARLPA